MNTRFEKEKLHFAAADGDLEQVERLGAEGYEVNAFDEAVSLTPLHYAVRGEHLEVAAYVLSVGADLNAHDEGLIDETPLGDVAAQCSYEMAELVVRAAADPTIEGWMQITALYRAGQRETEEGKRVHNLLPKSANGGGGIRG